MVVRMDQGFQIWAAGTMEVDGNGDLVLVTPDECSGATWEDEAGNEAYFRLERDGQGYYLTNEAEDEGED